MAMETIEKPDSRDIIEFGKFLTEKGISASGRPKGLYMNGRADDLGNEAVRFFSFKNGEIFTFVAKVERYGASGKQLLISITDENNKTKNIYFDAETGLPLNETEELQIDRKVFEEIMAQCQIDSSIGMSSFNLQREMRDKNATNPLTDLDELRGPMQSIDNEGESKTLKFHDTEVKITWNVDDRAEEEKRGFHNSDKITFEFGNDGYKEYRPNKLDLGKHGEVFRINKKLVLIFYKDFKKNRITIEPVASLT